jgi:hypothetical protein
MIDWRSRFFLFIALCDAALIFMAGDFGLVVWEGGSPITAEQYGAAVYEIPALVWATFQGGGAILGLIGAVLVAATDADAPLPRWGRAGAIACAAGNLSLAVMFSVFAFLSRNAEAGILLHSLTKFPGTWIYLGCTFAALRLAFWGDEL